MFALWGHNMDVVTFNLSILECKFVPCFGAHNNIFLLISPYWNVNTEPAAWLCRYARTFNLSILECKFFCRLQTPTFVGF